MRTEPYIVSTFGKHSARTPISYSLYQSQFKSLGFVLDNTSMKPDILIGGFHIDIAAEKQKIDNVKKLNPHVKIFIISEEPLWDLTWHKDPFEVCQKCEETGLEYFYLNHFSSNAFDLSIIPYFLTTESKYIARYVMLLSQLDTISPQELLTHWDSSEYLISCFVEKRAERKYGVTKRGFRAHSNFRTTLAENLLHEPCAQVQGKGWHTDKPRQSLPDWHADKLSRTYKRSKYLVAIENTDARSYITEKVFDAFSTLSIPVVVSSQVDELSKILANPAVFVSDTNDASMIFNRLEKFKPDEEYAKRYLSNIRELLAIFRNTKNFNFAVRTYTKSLTHLITKSIEGELQI